MKWDYWICLYTRTHCVARGLRPSTIGAYQATLGQFRAYIEVRCCNAGPDDVTAATVLEYLKYLREERDNGDSAINRQATILKRFYRAIVAMGHLLPAANPMAHFPRIKAKARKLPVILSAEEVRQLLDAPPRDTILGLRDRAILILLYGTGIRASECASVLDEDVDLDNRTIRVTGKGGHERVIPLNDEVVASLRRYRRVRGIIPPCSEFFRSRSKRGMSRGAIYERVRKYGQLAGIRKRISPHKLRHTFATHLVKLGTDIVTIRDLLGHRRITSTQVYLHVTARDLEEAIAIHPIKDLAPTVEHLLPDVKLPFQRPPRRLGFGSG